MAEWVYEGKDESGEEGEGEGIGSKVEDDSPRLRQIGGLWILTSNTSIVPVGEALHFGSSARLDLEQEDLTSAPAPIGLASPSTGLWYWILFEDGLIESMGAVIGFEIPGTHESKAVAIAPNYRGDGLYVAFADGSISTLGTAIYHGSAIEMGLESPIVSIATSRDGYLMLCENGKVVNFGEAPFHGSVYESVESHQAKAVDIVSHSSGDGYWILLENGFVIANGRCVFYGRPEELSCKAVSILASPDGEGYWIVDENGGVHGQGHVTVLPGRNEIPEGAGVAISAALA